MAGRLPRFVAWRFRLSGTLTPTQESAILGPPGAPVPLAGGGSASRASSSGGLVGREGRGGGSETDGNRAGGVRVEVEAGVAVLTIDRPEVRNAIGFATIEELDAALDRVLASNAAVLVLRGGGDRAFVSGGDLKEFGAIRTYEDA